MSLLGSISSAFKNHFDKNKEEQEIVRRVQREANAERLDKFEEQLRSDSFEVAMARAKKDAANKSGLEKLRQVNRVRNLEHNQPAPGSFFEKLKNHTQKNLANRDRNLQKTKEVRKAALEMKKDRQDKINVKNAGLVEKKTVFGTRSTWRR